MPGQSRGYFPGGAPLVSGAAPPDTPDDPGATHAPWASIRAQWEAENHRHAIQQLAAQNPDRYGGAPPRRDLVHVWETDRHGIDRLVRVEKAKPVERSSVPPSEETYANILRDLDPRRGPSSSFL